MTNAMLEHVNVTVSDPAATARRLSEWFGWHVRWNGPGKNGGTTYHVGSKDSYVAVYAYREPTDMPVGRLNHIGVQVDDLDAAEARIKASGISTYSHADYEPGRRFYFDDPDGIEFEVISYA